MGQMVVVHNMTMDNSNVTVTCGGKVLFCKIKHKVNKSYILGKFCETRIKKVAPEPIIERMFREPFWLGLLTVFLVMILISVGYLLRKHFPEKVGKFLKDDHEVGSLQENNTGEMFTS